MVFLFYNNAWDDRGEEEVGYIRWLHRQELILKEG
jgi:hypothetical protein